MYKTLLWATDGSVQSDAALELALDLLDADGHLIAVHCDQRFSGSHVGGLPVLPDEDERRERISARVDELRSSGVDAALTVRTTTTHDPSVVIARLADELDADAIVCGTRALHSVNATLGRQRRRAPSPARARAGLRRPAGAHDGTFERSHAMKPILLATDGSPSAEAATCEAIDLAARLQLPLLVVSVAHTDMTLGYGYYGYAEVVADIREAQHEHIAELLEQIWQRAADAGVNCNTLALDGHVGEQICRAAHERNARMIVMGAHGWGRLNRLVHGSVSTYVLHHSSTPVLVIAGSEQAAIAPAAPVETTEAI